MEHSATNEIEGAPFRLLNLPADVRNIIYYYALPTQDIRPAQISPPPVTPTRPISSHFPAVLPKVLSKPDGTEAQDTPPEPEYLSVPFVNLLSTNHQIFTEASYILCRHRNFTITLDWMHIRFPTIGTTPIASSNTPLIRASELTFTNSIHTIILEINWRTSFYLPSLSGASLTKSNLDSIFFALEDITNLKTVIVSWRDSLDGYIPVPSTWWCWKMLRGVYELGRKRPEIMIVVETPLMAMCRDRNVGEWIELGEFGEERMRRLLGQPVGGELVTANELKVL